MADYQQGVPINIVDTFRLAGVPTNPTAIVYTILAPDGTSTTYTWPGAPEVSNPGSGEFILALSPPADPGIYTYDVDATGAVVASRAGSFTVLANVAIPSDVEWAVTGPCTPWASSQDVWTCCGQPTVVINEEECNVDFTAEVMAASQVLFELSGRRYAGSCSKTVRPCGTRGCNFQVLSRGHIVDWQSYFGGWNGTYWQYDLHRGCGCMPLDQIKLSGYPVREITEVKIDGVIVDPDTYRLDERRYLSRVRDPADPNTPLLWPSCQAMDLPDTAEGTFSVSYRYGMDPPLVGSAAAAELACELYKACSGAADCRLPSNVTRVSRQGVVVEKPALAVWGLQNGIWATGLANVDVFLNAYNPTRMTRRPSTWSPDGPRYARQLG